MPPVYRWWTGGDLWGPGDDNCRVSVRYTLDPTTVGPLLVPKGPERVAQGLVWTLCIFDAWGVTRKTPQESDGRLCPAHLHRPEQPPPQGVGAVAAIERDDRAAISEGVPRCLPSSRGNKLTRAVQVGGGSLHTPRSSNSGSGSQPFTRSRRAARDGSHVPVPQNVRCTCSRRAVRYRDAPGGRTTAGRIDESSPTGRACARQARTPLTRGATGATLRDGA